MNECGREQRKFLSGNDGKPVRRKKQIELEV